MGAGELILVASSKDKYYLTKNPEITFFKIYYKRHTNFSIETIPQEFINKLDFGKQATLIIGRNGDLVSRVYLHIDLPVLNSNISRRPKYKIRYVDNLGYALINKIELEIGGTIISREYGEWMYIWKELTTGKDKKRGMDEMLGNNEKYNKFESSKISLSLDIPLIFWFCKSIGDALPLISLMKDEVKLHIDIRRLEEVLIQSPQKFITMNENFSLFKEYEVIKQNANGVESAGEFVEYDILNKRLYYNPLYGNFDIPVTDNNFMLVGENGYKMSIKKGSQSPRDVIDFFNLNYPPIIDSYCLVDYIFLDSKERELYVKRNHEYLIPITQNITEETVVSSNVRVNLPLVFPISGIFWRVILNDNIVRKEYFNYSMSPYTKEENSIIKNVKILINGQPLTNIEQEEYYRLIQRHNYYNGMGNSNLYNYSFSLYPLDSQPYGSLNFSNIDDASIQLTLDGLIEYRVPARIKVYGLSYNIFRIINQSGKLVFRT